MKVMTIATVFLLGILVSCDRPKTHSVTHSNRVIHEHYANHLPNYGEDRDTYYYLDKNIIVEKQTTYFPHADVIIRNNQTYYLNDDIAIEEHFEFPYHDVGTQVVVQMIIEEKQNRKITALTMMKKVEDAIANAREHRNFPPDFNLNYRFLSLDEIQTKYEICDMDYDEQEFYINSPLVRFELKDALPEDYFYFFQSNSKGKIFPVPGCPFPIRVSEMPDYLVQLTNYMHGEATDFIVIDNLGHYGAAHIVPRPIKIAGEKERVVTVEAKDSERKQFLVHLTGFLPYELCTIFIGSESGNHRTKSDVTMSKTGEGFLTIYPGNPCQSAGKTIVEVKGFTSPEILVTQLDWGDLSQIYPMPVCPEAAVAL